MDERNKSGLVVGFLALIGTGIVILLMQHMGLVVITL